MRDHGSYRVKVPEKQLLVCWATRPPTFVLGCGGREKKLRIMYNGCETCPTIVGSNRSRSQRKQEQEASGMLTKGEERGLQRFQKVKDKRRFVMTSTKRTCSDYVIKS